MIYALSGDYSATWTLDTNAAPREYVPDGFVKYTDVTGTFPGFPSLIELCFFVEDQGGGFEADVNGDDQTHYFSTAGDQLYDETSGAPVPVTGQFDLVRYDDVTGENDPTVTYHLSVTAAAPEPATWALSFVGVGIVGTALRRSRRQRPGPGRTAQSTRLGARTAS